MTLPERDLGYLEDVKKYAGRAIAHSAGVTYEQFVAAESLQDALIRCLMVIGEAAGRLSEEALAELPQFDWGAMKGMRNVLVHDYGRIDYTRVWDVVANELPSLHAGLEQYLGKVE